MDTIINYLESVFARVPDSPEVKKLKEEMLANMEEKYQELKAAGKSENEAIGTVISGFGNVDELFAELNIDDNIDSQQKTTESVKTLNFQQVQECLDVHKVVSKRIGLGVALVLIGLAVMLFIFSIDVSIGKSELSDTIAAIAISSFFVFLIPAVSLFIYFGLKLSKYNDLEYGKFRLDDGVETTLKSEAARNESKNIPKIIVGVVLCIVSVIIVIIPSVLSEKTKVVFTTYSGDVLFKGDSISLVSVSLMLLIVAIAVYLFITAGMKLEVYSKLLRKGDYAPELKKSNKVVNIVGSILWPLVLAIFLIWGLCFNGWGIAWILFPITGIIFGGFSAAMNAVKGNDETE